MNRVRNEYGATMVEAAIALPLFLVVIFTVTEVLWYFHVKISLEFAAQQAVDIAAKSPMETDLTNDACKGAEGIQRCERFRAALNEQVLPRGEWLAKFVAKGSDSGGSVRLVAFEHYDPEFYPDVELWEGLEEIGTRDIAVVRPGEAVKYKSPDPKNPDVKWPHPFRPDGNGDGQGWPQDGENWDDILRTSPIAAHIEAEYLPITPGIGPLFGTIRMKVTQYAFRSSGQRGISAPYVPVDFPGKEPPGGSDSDPGDPEPNPICQENPNPCLADNRYCCESSDALCAECGGEWNCLSPFQCVNG